MSLGNAKAIGDWFRGTRYSKNQIDEFFIKDSSGLTSFALTYYGHPNEEVTIEGQTSGEVYVFTLPSSGISTQLQFFEMGETVNISTYFGFSTTKILTNTTGDIKLFTPSLTNAYSKVFQGSSAESTFTAQDDGIYLCVNMHVHNGEHQDTRATLSFASSRSPIYEDFINQEYSGSDRTTKIKVGVFELYQGDSVKFTTNAGSYSYLNNQTHNVFKLDSVDITALSRTNFESKADTAIGSSKTIAIQNSGMYVAFGFINNTERDDPNEDVTISSGGVVYSNISAYQNKSKAVMSAILADETNSNSIIFNWTGSTGGFATRGYVVYKII